MPADARDEPRDPRRATFRIFSPIVSPSISPDLGCVRSRNHSNLPASELLVRIAVPPVLVRVRPVVLGVEQRSLHHVGRRPRSVRDFMYVHRFLARPTSWRRHYSTPTTTGRTRTSTGGTAVRTSSSLVASSSRSSCSRTRRSGRSMAQHARSRWKSMLDADRAARLSTSAPTASTSRDRAGFRYVPRVKPLTVMVTASGAPGTAALLHALTQNGERDVRLVGTDMSERSVGRHLCDAFHIVPAGSHHTFPDAVLQIAEQEQRRRDPAAVVVRPGRARRARRPIRAMPVLVSGRTRSGVRTTRPRRMSSFTGWACGRRRSGASTARRAVDAAARELGYPDRPVCFKPVFSSGSRGFRILDPTVDRAHQLLNERPGLGRDATRGGGRAAAGRRRAGSARDGARDRRRDDDRRDRRRQRDRPRPPEDPRGDARRPRDVLRHARRPAADPDRRT